MLLEMLKGKIHRARITNCDVDYEGSLEIDENFLDESGIRPYERILVVNATNGNRLETYAIPGARGSGIFRLNGAAAHRGRVGDIITVMNFAFFDSEKEAGEFQPKIIVMNEKNEIVTRRRGRREVEA